MLDEWSSRGSWSPKSVNHRFQWTTRRARRGKMSKRESNPILREPILPYQSLIGLGHVVAGRRERLKQNTTNNSSQQKRKEYLYDLFGGWMTSGIFYLVLRATVLLSTIRRLQLCEMAPKESERWPRNSRTSASTTHIRDNPLKS